MLLLPVLLLLPGDRILATEDRIDVLLLGLGMCDMQRREGRTHGLAIGLGIAQLAQHVLEAAMVVEDQVDDVT
jgi:hypothetical protein